MDGGWMADGWKEKKESYDPGDIAPVDMYGAGYM